MHGKSLQHVVQVELIGGAPLGFADLDAVVPRLGDLVETVVRHRGRDEPAGRIPQHIVEHPIEFLHGRFVADRADVLDEFQRTVRRVLAAHASDFPNVGDQVFGLDTERQLEPVPSVDPDERVVAEASPRQCHPVDLACHLAHDPQVILDTEATHRCAARDHGDVGAPLAEHFRRHPEDRVGVHGAQREGQAEVRVLEPVGNQSESLVEADRVNLTVDGQH